MVSLNCSSLVNRATKRLTNTCSGLIGQLKLKCNRNGNGIRQYWNDLSNQRKKFDEVAKELGVQRWEDWYTVSRYDVNKKVHFMKVYYKSLLVALQHLYPEFIWDASQFVNHPRKYWDNEMNQKQQLEKVAQELNIKELDDWYKVNRSEVRKKLCFIQYKYGSVYDALKAIYPQHHWNVFKFEHSLARMWTTSDLLQCKEMIQQQMKKFNVSQYSDWLKLPHEELKLFHRVQKRLSLPPIKLLHTLFPSVNWNSQYIQSSKAEQVLQNYLRAVTEVETHAFIGGHSIDVYLPQWGVAIEYQGGQHYKQGHTGSFTKRKDRDASKEQTLAQLGICLIKIPYWWNLTAEQLFHTIRKYRPEFLQSDHHDEEEQVVGHKDTQSHLTGCTPLPTPTVLPNQHFVLADQMSSL